MKRQVENFLFVATGLLLLGVVMMQGGCKKEFSEGDFVNTLKGEWYVNFYSSDKGYTITFQEDTISYYCNNNDYIYTINDPTICTLTGMENMGNWTITENNDTLQLETKDLCGGIKNYKIEFSNLNHQDASGGYYSGGDPESVYADVNINDAGTIITLFHFYIVLSSEPVEMKFTINTNEKFEFFQLYRR